MNSPIRLILLLFMGLCNYNASCAILNDSIVAVLADWNKGEKHLFNYLQYRYRIIGVDTIIECEYSRNFTIEVNDSTQHLYSLVYKRTVMPEYDDSIVIDEFPLRLMTNHNGALVKVLNWDSYLAWRNNDIEATSDALFPYVSLLSFNGKRLKLNNLYCGNSKEDGSNWGYSSEIVSESKMIATRDFEQTGEYELVTINTTTTYQNIDQSPIPVFDNFMQIIDSENGWAIATYFERKRYENEFEVVNGWNIKLLD